MPAGVAIDEKAMNSRRQLLYDLERHPLETLPLTQLFPVLVRSRPSWWTQPGETNQSKPPSRNVRSGANPSGLRIAIPETVVWENNIPKGWYSFDSAEGAVVRKKVETKQIQTTFLADAKYENDVVAVMYSISASGEKDKLEYQFISATELPGLLFENRKGKGTSILQKFALPLNITHNDTITAIWTPTVVQVSRRQNVNNLFDERIEVNDRCVTFEGKVHQTQLMQATSRLKQQVKEACQSLVQHFSETEPKYKITRLVAHFKMDVSSRLILLMATSCRIAQTNILSTDPNHITSGLQKKFRVSLDLATTFELASRSQPFNANRGSSALEMRAEHSMDFSASAHRPRTASPDEGHFENRSIQEPVVGRKRASRLGFLMRSDAVGDRSSLRSRAASATKSNSKEEVPLTEVLAEVSRCERSGLLEQKLKGRKLLEKVSKKVTATELREAYLSEKQELTDAQKLELFFLRLRHLEAKGSESVASIRAEPEIKPNTSYQASEPNVNVALAKVRLMEHLYALQSHLSVMSKEPFKVEVFSGDQVPQSVQHDADIAFLGAIKRAASNIQHSTTPSPVSGHCSLEFHFPQPFLLQKVQHVVNGVMDSFATRQHWSGAKPIATKQSPEKPSADGYSSEEWD